MNYETVPRDLKLCIYCTQLLQIPSLVYCFFSFSMFLKTKCMKQIASLRLKCHYQLWYYLYQILNTVSHHNNQAMFSASPGCSGQLRFKVNHQQPRSVGLKPIQKIPTPIQWLISPLPEVINQICKTHSLENSCDKKTSNELCDIFQK